MLKSILAQLLPLHRTLASDGMDEALRIWRREGLPELKLKEPWWGVNLGFWSEEHEELARSAAAGDHYKAGELYRQRRHPVE